MCISSMLKGLNQQKIPFEQVATAGGSAVYLPSQKNWKYCVIERKPGSPDVSQHYAQVFTHGAKLTEMMNADELYTKFVLQEGIYA